MTLLDDYEVKFKLQGVELVSEMLKNVPAELLRRTGIDGLLFAVSSHSYHFLVLILKNRYRT